MSIDSDAKRELRGWPNRTKIWSAGASIYWLRGQPIDAGPIGRTAPRLISAGATAFRVQPDGLWFSLGIPTSDEESVASYADCVVIEACGSRQNFFDKRSRYAARTTSVGLELKPRWLDSTIVMPGRGGPRWARRDVLRGQLGEEENIVLPVRHLRVLYVLPEAGNERLFDSVSRHVALEGHEYVCALRMLSQFNGAPMQAFLKSMAPSRQCLPMAV